MTLRCTVLDDYQGAALKVADWTPLAGRVDVQVLREHLTGESLVAALASSEIIVAMRERTPFDADLLRRLPNLRLLVTTGMRNASIDLEAAAAAGVTVCGTASTATPTVELTWALILGLARHVTAENRAFRDAGPWQSTVGTDLSGQTLGVIGLGRLGTRVAQVGAAFGMETVAWSPHLTAERAAAAGVRLAESKSSLMAESDVVTIHMVLSESTRGLLGEADLRAMKSSAFLVNTSRAGIVDPEALLKALRGDWIAGAALDVFETEPLPADDPLRSLPNVLATPHLGYVTERNYRTFYGDAVEDIAAFLAGEPVRVLAKA